MVFVVVVKSSGYIGSRRIGGGLITRNSGRDCSGSGRGRGGYHRYDR